MIDFEYERLIKKDGLTSHDLLEVAFGEFPPKGLDIVFPHSETLVVESMFADEASSENASLFDRFMRVALTGGRSRPL